MTPYGADCTILNSRQCTTFFVTCTRTYVQLLRPPPPSCLETKCLSGKSIWIALKEYWLWWCILLVPGQYLTQLWEIKDQIFAKSAIFQFYQHISEEKKTINRGDIKLTLACSPLSSEQNEVLLRFLDRIFVRCSIPEGNSVIHTGKTAWGQTKPTALIDIGYCKQAL